MTMAVGAGPAARRRRRLSRPRRRPGGDPRCEHPRPHLRRDALSAAALGRLAPAGEPRRRGSRHGHRSLCLRLAPAAALHRHFAAWHRHPPSPPATASRSSLLLGLVPFLEGGWGLIAEPHYLGLSNLPEVAFYVGLLPVVAAVRPLRRRWGTWLPHGERRHLVPRRSRSGSRSPSVRRRPSST